MSSIKMRTGAAAVSAIALVLFLSVAPAHAEGAACAMTIVTCTDTPNTDFSSAKVQAKYKRDKVVVKQLVVHPPLASRNSTKRGK